MSSCPKIMAVASAGGHWIQLMRLRKAWDGLPVVYVSTEPGLARNVTRMARDEGNPPPRFAAVSDANLSERWHLVVQFVEMLGVVLRHRPDVVITTGAAPGYFALRLGKILGARTIWIDSMANAGELSTSGREAGRYADLWLTQWEHLARPDGPRYMGAVL